MVDRLRSRFGITKVCIVADRGMMSKETIEELEKEERGWQYILGADWNRRTRSRMKSWPGLVAMGRASRASTGADRRR